MARRFRLTIADVCFSLSHPDALAILEDDPCYARFVGSPQRAPDALEFELTLRFDPPPDLGKLQPIFDTGDAWKAYLDDGDVLLSIPAPHGLEGSLWVVRMQSSGLPIELFLNRALTRDEGDRVVLVNPLRYPLDQILMMFLTAAYRCLVVHAAGLVRDGVGVLFAGVSGAGKSTLTGLLTGSGIDDHLSDDRVVVRRAGEEIRVWGTPWPGEAGVAANTSARLGALAFLRQADTHGLRALSPPEALRLLLPTVSILWHDPERMAAALEWCDELLRETPAFELSFARDRGVADTVDTLLDHLPG